MEDNIEKFVKDTMKNFVEVVAKNKAENTFDEFTNAFKKFGERFGGFGNTDDKEEVSDKEEKDLAKEIAIQKEHIKLLQTIIKDKEDIINLLRKQLEKLKKE